MHSKVSSYLLFLLIFFIPASYAEDVFTIGYVELKKDDRYKKKRLFAKFMGHALGRPFAGAETALKEVKFHGTEAGVGFALDRVIVKKPEELSSSIEALTAKGIHFILLDLPADVMAEVSKNQRDKNVALFNVSAYNTALREQQCQPNLYHTLPSHAMLADALAQYLISKKWRKILQLEGPLAEDKLLSAAFEAAAKRYGLKISDKRSFVLSNDPRERAKNNVALLTGGNHDVIYIADSQGEFARDVPYQTLKPSLIVGSEGLSAAVWHWSWERYGAPQLVKRFEKMHKRPMANTDWAAWMAVKAIAGAVQATKSTEFASLKKHLTSADNLLDTFKGNASNFRPWNNQLRQPLLLTTHNWVVDRAPLKGFLHQKNNLDTLGIDKRNSKCRF